MLMKITLDNKKTASNGFYVLHVLIFSIKSFFCFIHTNLSQNIRAEASWPVLGFVISFSMLFMTIYCCGKIKKMLGLYSINVAHEIR